MREPVGQATATQRGDVIMRDGRRSPLVPAVRVARQRGSHRGLRGLSGRSQKFVDAGGSGSGVVSSVG